MKQLAELQVNDEVLRIFQYSHKKIFKIEHITKTGRIKVNGNYYNPKTGNRIPNNPYSSDRIEVV